MATTQKRGDSYRITVFCGYDINGKQIRRTTTWTPAPHMTARQIKKELDRQAVLFEEKCLTGQVLNGNIRFADFAEKWFTDYAQKQLRPTTVSRYRLLMPRINAAIGHIRLDKLQPHHLMEFYKNLTEVGVREDIKYTCVADFKKLLADRGTNKREFCARAGVSLYVLDSVTRGDRISATSAHKIAHALQCPLDHLFRPAQGKDTLSTSTVLHHHRLISSILSSAVKWQVLFANPCARVALPRNRRKEAAYLDRDDVVRLLALLEGENIQHRTIIKMLLYTGMRRGELCGLEWSDIDFDNALITIRRSSLYLSGKGVFTDETKNDTSTRCIKVSADVIKLLRTFRTWQLEEQMRLGDRWQGSNRVFTTWDGAPVRPDTITGWFGKFVKKNNLPPVHIHSLRHTNASLMIAGGVNLQTVAKRLGHADTTTTSRIYAHAIQSADEAVAETLQDIFRTSKQRA